MQFWNELEGQSLDGYPLRRLLRPEGRTAWFETELTEQGSRPATISLVESLTDADEVTERLRIGERLHHPNLLAIHRVGQATLDRTLFVYAVMERVEQNLSDVLRDHTLNPSEVRQVAEALLGALTEIHRQGFAHGRVEPASVVSVGEAVKLRSDCLQSPGATRAQDIAGLGATLFEALSRHTASSSADPEIERLPAPFAEIVRNTLSSRWNLDQIAAALNPSQSQPAGTTPVRPPSPVQPGRVSPPPSPQSKPGLRGDTEPDKEQKERLRRTGLYAGLAVVVLLFLGWLIFRHGNAPVNSSAAAAGSSSATAAGDSAPATPPPPVAASSAARPSPSGTTAPGASPKGARSVWRVVAYTYLHRDQAQHKADEVNSQHPGLNAAPYALRGNSGPFLVVLGGEMDREQAFALLDKARGEGLPTDIYAQNFSH